MALPSRSERLALFGAGGFIGSNLAYHLESSGRYEAVLLDRVYDKIRLRYGGRPFRFVRCDVAADLELIDQAVRDADIVVNLVAYVHPSTFLRSPLDVVRLNLFHALPVVEACVRHGRRLIHFSTSEVYGKTGGSAKPFREDETDCILGPIANHRWIYSNAKQLLDRIIHAHGLKGDLEYTIVRPFNFVGPLMDRLLPMGGADNPRVFAHFMSALLFGRPLQLVNGGQSRRCFTYIDDATAALELIVRNRAATRNQIINIGNPNNETTIRDLAWLMRDIYRREFEPTSNTVIVDVDASQFYGPGYEDCDRRLPDIAKLATLGWTPRHDLETTFTLSMRYVIEHQRELLSQSELS